MTTFSFGNRKTLFFAVPAAFLLSYVFYSNDFLRIITFLLATIPLHEMGHAIAAWMGGRWALPLGAIIPTAGMTLISYSRSGLFVFVFFSTLLYGLYYFNKRKYGFHLTILLMVFFMSVYLTFRIDEMRLASLISMAGITGEIFLSTFLIIGFYYNVTKRFRWDFWRFPALLLGSTAFTNSAFQWYRIKNGLQELPMGAAVSGQGARDMNGDLNQLILAGWVPAQIIAVYWLFIKTCGFVILTYYILGLLKDQSKIE